MGLNELHKNTSGMDRKEPGEWIAVEESSTKTRANAMHRVALYYKRPNNAGGGVIGDLWGQGMEANAAFIVAAHREVPKLLEENARLREALEQAEKDLESFYDEAFKEIATQQNEGAQAFHRGLSNGYLNSMDYIQQVRIRLGLR